MKKIFWLLPFLVFMNSSRSQDSQTQLYLTRLKAVEAYFRLNQVSEAKRILGEIPENQRTWEWKLLNSRLDRSIKTLTGHDKAVVGIAVSKDGKLIASGSADSTIIIWDAGTYSMIRKIKAHRGQVTSIDFSPDGRILLSGSTDKTLRLWNVSEGKEIRNFNSEFSQGIYQAKFSPDGKKIAAVSWELGKNGVQGFAKLLDVETGSLSNRIDTDVKPASALDFYNDGKKIITGTWNFVLKEHDLALNNSLLLYDMSKFDYYTAVQSVHLSPDNKLIAEAGKDARIRILQADGKLIHQIDPWKGHSQWVNCVRFSPDGNFFASASDDGILKVWKTSSAEMIYSFKGHEGGLFQLAWHPSGRFIYTSSSDGTIKVWDLQNPGERTFDAGDNGPWGASSSKDGRLFATAMSDKKLEIWDLEKAATISILDTFSSNAVIISGDGKFVAAGGHNRIVRGFDLSNGKKIFEGKGHQGSIYGIDFNKKHNLVASAGDRSIRVWNAANGELLKTLSTQSPAYAVSFSPDDKILVAGCTDGMIKIFSTADWSLTDSLKAGTSVLNLAIHSNGKWLATVGANGQAFVFELSTRKMLFNLKGHVKTLYGLAMHPSEPILITVGYDRQARIWNLESGINTLTLYGFNTETYTTGITGQGNRLLIGEVEGLIHVIDLR